MSASVHLGRVRRSLGIALTCSIALLVSSVSAAEAALPSPPSTRYPLYGYDVYTTTPTLAGVFEDEDLAAGEGQGRVEFEVYAQGGGGSFDVLVADGLGFLTTNGGFSRWTVPAGSMQTDTAYRWRARALVGPRRSPWTDWRLLWVRSSGTRANKSSWEPSSSADGKTVAFASEASNLAEGDTNNVSDIYVRAEADGLTTRVSWSLDGGEPNAPSWEPSISDDGRYVAFSSAASNLVPGDTNDATDVFVADLHAGVMTRASVKSDGSQIPSATCHVYDPYEGDLYYLCGTPGYAPSISGDGRYVGFVSEVAGVAHGGTDGASDVYLFDRLAGRTVERVSAAMTASAGGGSRPSVSDDGSKVAFDTWHAIVSGDTNGASDVFVRDRTAGLTRRASVSTTSVQGNGNSTDAAISGNGLSVAFASTSSNLLERDFDNQPDSDTNGKSDVFHRNLQSGRVMRASGPLRTWEPNGSATGPSISNGGTRVAFESRSSNHGAVPCTDPDEVCDSNGVQDIFEWASVDDTVTRVSFDDRYGELEQSSQQPSMAGDGTSTTFATASAVASGLAPGSALWPAVGIFHHSFGTVGCILDGFAIPGPSDPGPVTTAPDDPDDPETGPDENGPPTPTLAPEDEQRAFDIIASDSNAQRLLGGRQFTSKISPWTKTPAGGTERLAGATLELTLASPQSWGMQPWPAIDYGSSGSNDYTQRMIELAATDVPQLLVDVDFDRDGVAGIEPVGGELTLAPGQDFERASDGESEPVPTARRGNLRVINILEDGFRNYDFKSQEKGVRRDNVDWPVNLVFWNRATVNRVKGDLDQFMPHSAANTAKHARVDDGPGHGQWDEDSGRKDAVCVPIFGSAPVFHYRAYAPRHEDRPSPERAFFFNRSLGVLRHRDVTH